MEKGKLKNMWKDKKGKAILKLVIWFFFLLIVILIAAFAPKNNNLINELNTPVSYEKMINNLLTTDLSYSYKTKILEVQTNYVGNISNGVNTGYLENSKETIKYSCTTEICYRVLLDSQEKIENPFVGWLDLNNVVAKLKNNEYETKEENTYVYSNELKDYELTVMTDSNNITQIIITGLDVNYELDFSYNK